MNEEEKQRLDGETCSGCGSSDTICFSDDDAKDSWVCECLSCGEYNWTIDEDGQVFFEDGTPV